MRIAQIGSGGWGKNHARVLSQLGALCAICDADKERSREYSERYSVNEYNSVGDLLDNEEFDAALVCTPTSTHAQIATQLLEAKKHVFVEKPLTYDSSDGEKLRDLAAKNRVLLTSGYIERFNPAVDVVKNFVESKKYGDLVMLEFHRESRMPPHIKDVGIIYDTSVHDIDTAMWLFGETPNVVFARAGQINHEHEDFASIMLGFANNRVAIISSNWITPTRVRKFNAVCTDAIVSSDFISQEIRVEKKEDTEIPRAEKKEPLLLEIQKFIDAAEGRAELRVKPQQAVNATKVAEAALLSAKTGAPIYLELK